MADPVEHRDRGLFHFGKKANEPSASVETKVQETVTVVDGKPLDAKADSKKHAHLEHIAEAGALLGGVIAKHEQHQAKKHPEDAHKHRVVEAVAGAVAAGSAVYAAHERHDKKEAKTDAKHHH